jgi:TonB-linked SusC/RagA family outer membrane protein
LELVPGEDGVVTDDPPYSSPGRSLNEEPPSMSRNSQAALAVAAMLLGAVPSVAAAQQGTTISGRVTGDAQAPLPSVSVTVPSVSAGTMTDAEGRYTITIPASRVTGQMVTVYARRIGYEPKSATIRLSGTAISQDFTLSATAMELNAIVVTALGVQREKSQLGTAVQQVSSNDLTQTKAQGVVEQLEGKVAGVQITGSGSPGGSSYIVIRGANSITGDNTPLFIVDGVPVSHADHGASANGGWDFGSAINDLNQDDIESMTVLKGPNAAALYGSRAANGVILITTKSGRNSGGGMRVDANSFYTWERPSRIPDYQNQYGQGAGGQFMFIDGLGDGVNDGADQSWGPMLDGRTTGCTFIKKTKTYDTSAPCKQFDAINGGPWVAQPNNVASFFNTANTASATVAVSGGTDRANARLSAGTDNASSIIPGTYLQKTNALLTGTLQVTDRLSADATVNYIRNNGRDRPGQGYSNSILESFVWFGRQVNMDELKNDWQVGGSSANGGPDGREFNWNYNYHNNPFFLMYGNPEGDNRDRLIGNVSATYKVTDWLNLTGRTGSDWYRLNINQNWSPADITGAPVNPSYNGAFALSNEYNNETNSEALFTANKAFQKISLSGTFGGNIRKETYNWSQVATPGISAPGIYNVSNAAIAPTNQQTTRLRQVNSVYGSASYTWNGWWTVEGTARNDWSSTLPQGANSYFYPSVNTAFVLSDLFPAISSHGISFLKLRGSIAKVGNDADPYQLRTTYTGVASQFNGLPQFSYSDVIANALLKPEITRSTEGGIEVAFLHGRVDLDATYYDKNTRNQIFPVSISPATGFSSVVINAGRVKNEGAEAQLTIQALQMHNGFNWTTGFNFSKNASRVVTLYPGISRIRLGSTWGVDVEARAGQPYGTLFGTAFARDSATGLPLTDGGLTVAGSKQVLGNIQPDWVGGWNNTFTFKNWSLGGLFDVHKGGNLWSVTNFWGDYAGVLKSSLAGREVDWNKPGVVVKGIDVNTGQPNTVTVTAEQYFQNIYPVNEPYIFNDTWVKLRELRLGYELSPRFASRLHANSMNLALVGRNLYTWTKVPNVDPEVSYSASSGTQGEEYGEIPNTRSFGVSVRITP